MGRPCPVTEAQKDEIIAHYRDGRSTHWLSNTYHASRDFVKCLLRDRGIQMRTIRERQHRFDCDEGAFDDAVNDEEAAYWCGFLMTDGCITSNKHTDYVILRIKESDRAHVERLRRFLRAQHEVKLHASTTPKGEARKVASLAIGSTRLVEQLAKYGVVPLKTRTAEARGGIENSRHFWRGVLDGDGCIGFRSRKHYEPTAVVQFCSASERLMSQFVEHIRPAIGSTTSVWWSRGTWCCMIHTLKAVALIRHLYADCRVALDRKHGLAKKAMLIRPKYRLQSPSDTLRSPCTLDTSPRPDDP